MQKSCQNSVIEKKQIAKECVTAESARELWFRGYRK